MPNTRDEHEISLLNVLKSNPNAGQRDMAEAIGLSLGMTNLLVKQLTARGWMLMRHLTSRKVQYALTPEGLKELSSRSYRFIKKSIRNVADCRVRLEALVIQIQQSGIQGLHLVGSSDVDFVLDWLCRQHGVAFRNSNVEPDEGWFRVYSENKPEIVPNILTYMEER